MKPLTNIHEPFNPYSRLFVLFWLSAAVLLAGFHRLDNPAYKAEIEEWHQRRLSSLKSENGWLNLAGLFWLKEGQNVIGSNSTADIAFPMKAPAKLGVFKLQKGVVTFEAAKSETILSEGSPVVGEVTVFSPDAKKPVVLEYGSLRWFIIKRGERYGIRLRDLESPVLKNFHGIERFPVDEVWRVKATLQAPTPGATIAIMDVLGQTSQQPLAGTLVFDLNGKTYKLDAVAEGEKLFILFADATSGKQTYGAGRFLYADKPGPDGTTYLDFNQAINPPCAFTPYATCPLPPRQNRLAIAINAGEKKTGDH